MNINFPNEVLYPRPDVISRIKKGWYHIIPLESGVGLYEGDYNISVRGEERYEGLFQVLTGSDCDDSDRLPYYWIKNFHFEPIERRASSTITSRSAVLPSQSRTYREGDCFDINLRCSGNVYRCILAQVNNMEFVLICIGGNYRGANRIHNSIKVESCHVTESEIREMAGENWGHFTYVGPFSELYYKVEEAEVALKNMAETALDAAIAAGKPYDNEYRASTAAEKAYEQARIEVLRD